MKGDQMYHYVYKTTNLKNGKFYVGKHSTKNLNDGYLGSGTELLNAINKHGKANFKTEVLYFCETEEEARKLESAIVTREFCDRDDTYNKNTANQAFTWTGVSRPEQADVMRQARPWDYRSPDFQSGPKNHRYGKPAINRKAVMADRAGELVILPSIKDMAARLGIGRAAVRSSMQGRAVNRDGWRIQEIELN